MSRLHPIRFSRKNWNIPLYCYHRCVGNCNKGTKCIYNNISPETFLCSDDKDINILLNKTSLNNKKAKQ